MLAILNYHNIATVPTGMGLPQLYVSPGQFARQLEWLRRIGLRGISLSEGLRRMQQGTTAGYVALTFDDGYADNVVNAVPILQQFGFAATCFVVSQRIGAYNTWDAERLGGRKPLMSRGQIQTWIEAGFEIGSHTCTHADLTVLPRHAVMDELVSSRMELSRITGQSISTFCYPFGRIDPRLPRCVGEAGYKYAVTTRRGRADLDDDLLSLPRISVDGRKSLCKFLLKAATPYCDVGKK